MKITAEQYAKALHEALQETKPSDYDAVLNNFVSILHTNGQLGMYGQIEEEFLKQEQKVKGQIPMEAIFAREHEGENLLNKLNEIVGADVVVKKKIDEGIIGGVIIEGEDRRIDASVRRQLRNLKKSLTN